MTHQTAAQLTLARRIKSRKLPNLNIPQTGQDELDRSLHDIAEHLRLYEGGGAPTERFVSLEDLEASGLISTVTRQGFATISKVLGGDVPTAKTSNPLQKVIISSSNIDTLDGIGNVATGNKKTTDFLRWNGAAWVPFGLMEKDNVWKGRQLFQDGVIDFIERAAGPVAKAQTGYVWVKNDTPNTLLFTADNGVQSILSHRGIPFSLIAIGTSVAHLNQPNSLQFWATQTTRQVEVDLSGASQVRLTAEVTVASASANTPIALVRYFTSRTGTPGSYLLLGSSEVSVSLTSTGDVDSGWINIVAGAQLENAFISIMGDGGDGVADPRINNPVFMYR